jgi:hypothetical protein
MSPRTLFLSRLIGLYCILAALSMITRKQATVETVTALLHNPLMIFIVGVITLAAGLAMVLAHNIWSCGALPVVVTLVGWVTLLKSLLLLFLPVDVEADFFLRQLHYPDLFYAYGGLSLVLGIYLTYSGFSPHHASQRLSEARKRRGCIGSSSKHLSRFTAHTNRNAVTIPYNVLAFQVGTTRCHHTYANKLLISAQPQFTICTALSGVFSARARNSALCGESRAGLPKMLITQLSGPFGCLPWLADQIGALQVRIFSHYPASRNTCTVVAVCQKFKGDSV